MDAVGERGEMPQERRQGHEVLPVVLKHAPKKDRVAPSQVVQPGDGCLGPGQVVVADNLQNMTLDRGQPAVLMDIPRYRRRVGYSRST